MKRNLILSLSILMLVLMQACGGGSEKAKDPNMGTAMADPFEELNQMVESIIDGGGVAALGEASSRERSMAKSAAEVDARGKLRRFSMRKYSVFSVNSKRKLAMLRNRKLTAPSPM
jgi:hypothetical protein